MQKDESGLHGFTVQIDYPVQGQPIARSVPPKLETRMRALSNRDLSPSEIISLGEDLAALLLPADVPNDGRALYERQLAGLQQDQELGLRLRLVLDPSLQRIPWEYMYIQVGGGEKDNTGFLALDPRISIVRHEAMPIAGTLDTSAHPRRLLVVLAGPDDPRYPALQLPKEKERIQQAVEGLSGLHADYVDDATTQALSDALLKENTDIFHFAGHGDFERTGYSTTPGVITGQGEVILVDESKHAVPMRADQLAVNLRSRGVQLVVLGACKTAQRDDANIWSGVVAALMEAGIPCAVAMQYKIADSTGLEFSRNFYHALAAGLPLDAAVGAARLAIFNKWNAVLGNPELAGYWCDWGAPVLYLRTGYDQVFALPTIVDPVERETMSNEALVQVGIRAKIVRGEITGFKGDEVTSGGRVDADIEAGDVEAGGKVVGADVGRVGAGGGVSVKETAGTVSGSLTGATIGSVGGPGAMRSARNPILDQPQPTASGPTGATGTAQAAATPGTTYCSQCGAALRAGARFCSKCGSPVVE